MTGRPSRRRISAGVRKLLSESSARYARHKPGDQPADAGQREHRQGVGGHLAGQARRGDRLSVVAAEALDHVDLVELFGDDVEQLLGVVSVGPQPLFRDFVCVIVAGILAFLSRSCSQASRPWCRGRRSLPSSS